MNSVKNKLGPIKSGQVQDTEATQSSATRYRHLLSHRSFLTWLLKSIDFLRNNPTRDNRFEIHISSQDKNTDIFLDFIDLYKDDRIHITFISNILSNCVIQKNGALVVLRSDEIRSLRDFSSDLIATISESFGLGPYRSSDSTFDSVAKPYYQGWLRRVRPSPLKKSETKVARTTVPEAVDDEKLKKPFDDNASGRNANRTTVPRSIRVSPQLVAMIDECRAPGQSRSGWLIHAVETYHLHAPNTPPPDYADFKGEMSIQLSAAPEFHDRLKAFAKQDGLKTGKWLKRVAYWSARKQGAELKPEPNM